MATKTPTDTISPSDQYKILKNPTLEDIPDRRGPRVYQLGEVASLNGDDPDYHKKDGVEADLKNE